MRWVGVALMVLIAAVAAVACRLEYRSQAMYITRTPPPPDRAEQRPPSPAVNTVWVAGYWENFDGRWSWHPGEWRTAQPGFVWHQSHWEAHGNHYEWVEGRWDPQPAAAPGEEGVPGAGVSAQPAPVRDDGLSHHGHAHAHPHADGGHHHHPHPHPHPPGEGHHHPYL